MDRENVISTFKFKVSTSNMKCEKEAECIIDISQADFPRNAMFTVIHTHIYVECIFRTK